AGTLICGARTTAVSGKTPSRPYWALRSTWLLHHNQVLWTTSMFVCAEKSTTPFKCSVSDSIFACHDGRFVKFATTAARCCFSGHSTCPSAFPCNQSRFGTLSTVDSIRSVPFESVAVGTQCFTCCNTSATSYTIVWTETVP